MQKTARLFVVTLVIASAGVSQAQSWPRFRGTNGAGVAESVDVPSKWSDDHQLWRTRLPGQGHASPVVWGDFLIAQCADADDATQWLARLNVADGSIAWKKPFAHVSYDKHKRSSFSTSTPAVDAEFIFAAWGSPERTTLVAMTHDGTLAWEQELAPFFGRHGFGSSPIVVGDLVVLSLIHGGEKSERKDDAESYVVAFDRRTGELKWKLPRANCTASYSSPCLITAADDRPQLVVCSTANGMFGIEPQTGRQQWAVDVFDKRVVSSPIQAGPLLIATTGSGAGSGNYVVAVMPGPEAREVYRVRDSAPYVPTPVVLGDLAFLWSDKGVVTCIETRDGTRVWRNRVGGNYSASPIILGDRVVAIADDGKVVLIAASRQFKILGRNDLGELSRASPAAADGRLFLRTLNHITCIGSSSLAPPQALVEPTSVRSN